MFKPRTFVVPLYQGDWQQRISLAEREVEAAKSRAEALAKARPAAPRMMHETTPAPTPPEASPEVTAAIAAHDELVAEAEAEGSVQVTLTALGRKAWNALVAAHPPRTDESVPQEERESDKAVGVNEETFGPALLEASIVKISDPEESTGSLIDAVSAIQFTTLYYAAFQLNRDGGPVPKALGPSPSIAATAN